MAPFRRLRWPNSRRGSFDVARALIRNLWLVTDELAEYQIQAYKQHIKECRKVKDDQTIACEMVVDVLKLCDVVNENATRDLVTAYAEIRKRCAPASSQRPVSDESIHQAIMFAMQLCHFVSLRPELRQGPQSMKDALCDSLTERTSAGPKRTLSKEFCEKTLTRVAAIKIRYTSDLRRHLELRGQYLLVFRHGTALKAYTMDKRTSSFYPPGFLEETQATVDLIFPVGTNSLIRRKRRQSEKYHADLEIGALATLDGEPDRELDSYRYWGKRLALIDDRYQSSRPGRLKQWYYDRRNRDSMTTFWFALSAFTLAVIFGLISSVTAMMQTWKAYHLTSH